MKLSKATQRHGQQAMLRFALFNGFAVGGIMENVLLLWALRNGLSDVQVAVMASFFFLTMPFMFVGKRLTARMGLSRAWSVCWILRYACVVCMLPAPWLQGTAWQGVVPFLIMVCSFGLFAFRCMGMVNTVPLQAEICSSDEYGSFLASFALRFNMSFFLGSASVVAVLWWRDTLTTYQVFMLAACLIGFYSSRILMRIPESETPRRAARRRIGDDVALLWRRGTYRRLALAWGTSMATIALITPFSMLALKRMYGVPDQEAMFFALAGLVGAQLVSAAMRIVSDEVGPRPLMLLAILMQMGVAFFWAFVAGAVPVWMASVLFVVGGAVTSILMTCLQMYLLAVSPREERIGIAMLLQVVGGVVSGLAGMLLGSGLIKILEGMGLSPSGVYSLYFRIMLPVLLLFLISITRMDRLREWHIKDVVGLMLSFRDMRLLYSIHKLQGADGDRAEHRAMLTSALRERRVPLDPQVATDADQSDS